MRALLNWFVYMLAFLVLTIFIPGMIKRMPFMMLAFLMVVAVLVMRKDFIDLVQASAAEESRTSTT